jgi:hypothetical protein
MMNSSLRLFNRLPNIRFSSEAIIRALQAEPERFTGDHKAPQLHSTLRKVYANILGNEEQVVLLQKIKNGHGHSLTLKATPTLDAFILSSRDHEPPKIRGDKCFLKCDTQASIDKTGIPKAVGDTPVIQEYSSYANQSIYAPSHYEPLVKFETAKGYQAVLRQDIAFNELSMPTAHLYQFLQGKDVYDIPAEVYIGKSGKKRQRLIQLNTKRDLYSLPKPIFKAFEEASKLFSKLQPGKYS